MELCISNGYLIRFPGISPDTIARWQNDMKSKSPFFGFSFSCVQTACSALKDGFGIRIAGTMGPHFLSGRTLVKALQNGFVDSSGASIPFEIYRTSRRVPDMPNLVKKLYAQDKILAPASVLLIVVAVGPTAYASGKLYLLVKGSRHLGQKRR